MPNTKLFGGKIEKLSIDLWDDYLAYNTSQHEDPQVRENFISDFRTLMAAVALANDPAYEQLEQLPEDMDVDREIEKRRKELEADEAFRTLSADELEKIVGVPREE